MKKLSFFLLNVFQAAFIVGIIAAVVALILFITDPQNTNSDKWSYLFTAIEAVLTVFAAVRIMVEFKFMELNDDNGIEVSGGKIALPLFLALLAFIGYALNYSNTAISITDWITGGTMVVGFGLTIWAYGSGVVFLLAYSGAVACYWGYFLGGADEFIMTGLAVTVAIVLKAIAIFLFTKAPAHVEKMETKAQPEVSA
jgi:hypothetical protein